MDETEITRDQARTDAHAKLIEDGWRFEGGEYHHPTDGRRGVLAVAPGPRGVKRVELHFAGRKPTLEDLMNRVPTAPPSEVVVDYTS